MLTVEFCALVSDHDLQNLVRECLQVTVHLATKHQ